MTSNTMKYVAIAGLVSVAFVGAAFAVTLHEREQQTALMEHQAAELQKMKGAEVETETAKIKRLDERRQKIMAAHEPGPIVADYCEVSPSSLFGEAELSCKLTGFETVEEVYLARWKVVNIASSPLGSYVFIERAAPAKK